MLLEDALKGYFMSISADGYAQSTISMYRWSLGMMATSVGNKEMNDIEPEDLQKFWIFMREEYIARRKNKSTAPIFILVEDSNHRTYILYRGRRSQTNGEIIIGGLASLLEKPRLRFSHDGVFR